LVAAVAFEDEFGARFVWGDMVSSSSQASRRARHAGVLTRVSGQNAHNADGMFALAQK
jgi:hypothetical protein